MTKPTGRPHGRPPNFRVQYWADRFQLKQHWTARILTPQMMSQLSFCKDDEARRILLGISK
jgi:hypothetical protein